jgi:hypothetical protein
LNFDPGISCDNTERFEAKMDENSTVVQGLDEEYHNIDISEASSTKLDEPGDFHMVRTQDVPSTSTEAALPTSTPTLLDSGSLGIIDSTPSSSTSANQARHRGKAASYLEGKGFGWLLEVEDEEEDAKPLL